MWTASSLRGPWRLADTTGIRPGAELGTVWSPEFAGENRPGRTVVAPWREYWHDDQFGKRGEAWAPEPHYFRGRWYLVACTVGHSQKVGSFLLVSEGGVEGPYRLVRGNLNKPFGDSFIGGPSFIKPCAYHHIDGNLYTEGDEARLVLHNHLHAKFRDVGAHLGQLRRQHPLRLRPARHRPDAVPVRRGRRRREPLRRPVLPALDRGRRRRAQQLRQGSPRRPVGDVLPQPGLRLLGRPVPRR